MLISKTKSCTTHNDPLTQTHSAKKPSPCSIPTITTTLLIPWKLHLGTSLAFLCFYVLCSCCVPCIWAGILRRPHSMEKVYLEMLGKVMVLVLIPSHTPHTPHTANSQEPPDFSILLQELYRIFLFPLYFCKYHSCE